MHPIKHLFEEIYRNYWGIAPAAERPQAWRRTKPVAGYSNPWSRPDRRRD